MGFATGGKKCQLAWGLVPLLLLLGTALGDSIMDGECICEPPATSTTTTESSSTTPGPVTTCSSSTTPGPVPTCSSSTTPGPVPTCSSSTTPGPVPTCSSSTTPGPVPTCSSSTTPGPVPACSSSTTPGPVPTCSSSTTPPIMNVGIMGLSGSQPPCYSTSVPVVCPPTNGQTAVNTITLQVGCTVTLVSPGWEAGEQYPNGPYTCEWNFIASGPTSRLGVTLLASNLQIERSHSTGCSKDVLMMEPLVRSNPQLKLCRRLGNNKYWDSVANTLTVTFDVDDTVVRDGFSVDINAY